MTDVTLAATAPVFAVDGELVRELARDCHRLEVCEGTNGLKTLRASLYGSGAGAVGPQDTLLHLDGSTVDLGQTVTVALGPPAEQRLVFEGQVSALELMLDSGEPPVVVVHAEDALMRLRMTRRVRTYRNVTDADVAAELAREHGLQADVEAEGPRYDVLQQANQSDLAFLRERARTVQSELWATGRTLHFRGRRQRQGTEVTLTRDADLLTVWMVADLAHQRDEVTVTGWDAERKQAVVERARADVVEAEVFGGRTGARLVAKALGGSASLRVREVALTAEEANAWARAEMLRRSRQFVTVRGTTNGTPELVVGSRLTLRLVGAPFDGPGYYVTLVRHTFDLSQGFRTGFEAERATLNGVA